MNLRVTNFEGNILSISLCLKKEVIFMISYSLVGNLYSNCHHKILNAFVPTLLLKIIIHKHTWTVCVVEIASPSIYLIINH